MKQNLLCATNKNKAVSVTAKWDLTNSNPLLILLLLLLGSLRQFGLSSLSSANKFPPLGLITSVLRLAHFFPFNFHWRIRSECDGPHNYTQLLEELLTDYDKRLRPNYGGKLQKVSKTIIDFYLYFIRSNVIDKTHVKI